MVTVLLCTYNGAAYVRAQLQSILDQTVQDLHVVVSDDGSTDETLGIVEAMAAAYPGRITILRQDPPTGSAERHFLKLLVERAYDVPGSTVGIVSLWRNISISSTVMLSRWSTDKAPCFTPTSTPPDDASSSA